MHSELVINLALAGIDDQTRRILRETWPVVRERVPQVLDALYGQGTYRPGLKPPTADETTRMAEARDAQERHWEALFAAEFDDEYAASVSRIALTHVRVGLRPAWFVSGYLVALTELHSLLLNAHSESIVSWRSRTRMEQAIRAVDKAVLFDLQLGVSAYFSETEAGFKRRLATLADRSEQSSRGWASEDAAAADQFDGATSGLLTAAEQAHGEAATAREGAARAAVHVAAGAKAVEQATAAIDLVTRQANAAAAATAGAVAAVDGAVRLTEGLGGAALRMVDAVGLLERLTAETGALLASAVMELGQHASGGATALALAEQVKALSGRIGGAAATLRGEVGRVQAVAASVAGAIGDVQTTLGQVRNTTGAVAGAMARQAEATQDIGRASAGAMHAIGSLTGGAERTAASAAQAAERARSMASVSEHLRRLVAERSAIAQAFVEDLRNADRRAEPREPASASVMLTFGDREVRGVLHDVSRGGASVLMDTAQIPDDPGPITVRAPHAVASAAARVVRRTAQRLHLAFNDPDEADRFVTTVLDRSASLSAEHRPAAPAGAKRREKLDFAAPHHHSAGAPPDAVLCAAIPR